MALPPETDDGLMAWLRRMMDSALALLQNRFQLFAVELQEEKVRLFDLLLRAAAVFILGFMTLIAGTALLVVWLWDTSPVAVLLLVTLAYGLTAAGIGFSIRRKLQRDPPPFAGTVEEFKRDRECLRKHD